jgi:hypothetical protein
MIFLNKPVVNTDMTIASDVVPKGSGENISSNIPPKKENIRPAFNPLDSINKRIKGRERFIRYHLNGRTEVIIKFMIKINIKNIVITKISFDESILSFLTIISAV